MTSDPLHLLTPRPTRKLWPMVLGAAVAALVLGVGGTLLVLNLGSDTTVRGEVSLYGADNIEGSHGNCRGKGGYVDLRIGAEVVVSDNAGATIGLTQLRDASLVTDGGYHCVWTFTADVPAGKGFYGVEVTHRGRVQYPEAQIGGIRLSLGGAS